MSKFFISASFAFVLALLISTSVSAQTKVTRDVEESLSGGKKVRVIVVTRPDPEQGAGGAAIADPAGYLSGRLSGNTGPIIKIGRLPVVSTELTPSQINTLRADPNIALIAEDVPIAPALVETVSIINADDLHAVGHVGENATVAVLDTGIDATHPAFAGSIVAQACFSTRDSNVYTVQSLCPGGFEVSLLPNAAEACGQIMAPGHSQQCDHGSHVAAIVAGHGMTYQAEQFSGVAPAANILPVQIFTRFDDPDICGAQIPCLRTFVSDQLRALEWLYRQRDAFNLAAVNMSIGSGYKDRHCDLDSPLTEIIDRLKFRGILTVIAAGNSRFFDGVGEPGCISSAITVAAMDKSGALDVSYSNVSPLVDLAAPGTAILSAIQGSRYAEMSGTSMAAPHVAGAIALLRARYPDLSALQIESILKRQDRTVSDPRTRTTLFQLDLADEVTTPSVLTLPPAGGLPQPIEKTGLLPNTETNFIIRTEGEDSTVANSLNQLCLGNECTVKRIGEGTFSLEIPAESPGGVPSTTSFDRKNLEEMLGSEKVKVFQNKLFSPSSIN